MKKTYSFQAIATALLVGAGGLLLMGSDNASAQSCPAGDDYLPYTGLCSSQAARLLPPLNKEFADGATMFKCEAAVNEASFLQGAILYWAANCKGQSAKLEMRVQGTSADLYVVKSHLAGEGAKPDKAGEYTGGLTISPIQYATNTAQTWMQHFSNGAFKEAQIAKCQARPEPAFGRNIYVVDEYSLNNQPEDSYRDACGQYGMMAGETSYWQLGQNDAWFFSPRFQDAMQDFERSSITFVKKNASGQWMRDANPGQMMQAAVQVSNSYELADIAGMPGAQEAHYGTARDYQVYSATVNGAFRYCVGERKFGQYSFRIGFDGGQWQIAVPYSTKPDYYGSYEIDGASRGMSGTSKNGWTFWWFGISELAQLRNGSQLIMNIDRASADFPLNGSAATITKVEECVHRQGRR